MPSPVVCMPKVTEGDEWGVGLIDDDISQIDYEGSAVGEKRKMQKKGKEKKERKAAGNQRIQGTQS